MSRAERQTFDAFIDWLATTLAFLSKTGRDFLHETEAKARGGESELIKMGREAVASCAGPFLY